MKLSRRTLLAGAAGLTTTLMAPTVLRAQEKVVKMGALKLIHSIAPYFYDRFTPAGYKVEIIPFESPTDGKNAVVTRSVDFGMFGLAAATLGAAAGEPVVIIAGACNKGMAVIAKKDGPVKTIKDLKGKRIAIWPGSTQEVVILDRFKAEGMSLKDVTPVRISFSEMHTALARGDIDAYVGAEPGPGISLSSGVGQLVEYPYSTPTGSLNMVFCTHEKMLTDNPELIRVMLKIHQQASEFGMRERGAMIETAMQRLGQKRESIELAAPNVELTWRMDQLFMQQARYYGTQMLAAKQIRQLPDYSKFIRKTFNDELV